jgi:hypothetical protein
VLYLEAKWRPSLPSSSKLGQKSNPIVRPSYSIMPSETENNAECIDLIVLIVVQRRCQQRKDSCFTIPNLRKQPRRLPLWSRLKHNIMARNTSKTLSLVYYAQANLFLHTVLDLAPESYRRESQRGRIFLTPAMFACIYDPPTKRNFSKACSSSIKIQYS